MYKLQAFRLAHEGDLLFLDLEMGHCQLQLSSRCLYHALSTNCLLLVAQTNTDIIHLIILTFILSTK